MPLVRLAGVLGLLAAAAPAMWGTGRRLRDAEHLRPAGGERVHVSHHVPWICRLAGAGALMSDVAADCCGVSAGLVRGPAGSR